MKNLLFYSIVIFGFWLTFISAQEFEISGNSYVAYEVEARAFGLIPNRVIGINQNIHGKFRIKPETEVYLSFPVLSFRSGNTTRDESVARILKQPEFPVIKFNLIAVEDSVINQVMNHDSGQFLVRSELMVAGKTVQLDLTVDFTRESPGAVNFKTQKYAKFTDFNLEPPTLGYFVQIAPDRLLLRGELIVNVKP